MFFLTPPVHSPRPSGWSGEQEGRENERFPFPRFAGTKAERREKAADRAHGGEVHQEFSVICAIRPFFLPSGFSSCRRGNKKSVLFPASPSPQEFGRSIIILTFCIETCYIFVNTYKYFVGEHFILPFKGPGRYTRGVRTEA